MMDRVRPFDEEFGENSNHLERRKSHSKPKPFTSKSLQEIDKDGNGIIDERELESYVEEHHHTIREKVLLKRVLYIVVGVLLVFAALISVGTYMIVELTKEVDVNDNDNVLRGGKDEQMVVTDTPKYYTTLQDIEKLTPAALNSLRRLSFVTANGKTHNYAVDGTQMSTNGGAGSNTIIYFSSSRAMIIRNGTFLFREVGFDGVAVEVDVLVDQAPNQRRLSSLLTEDKSCSQYLHRCSVKSGVCFHTYDEIVSLHADSMIVGNNEASRRLDSEESYITFAEIQANVEILSKDNLSSIDRASALITGLMKNFTSSKGRVTLSFQMSERCVNYPDLVADCNGFPVPDVIYADQDLASLLTPFTGLVPSDGRWVFRDSIEYSIDPYTIQLKVRYSHDTLSDSRRHVVMMKRSEPSKYITYDEVTTSTDPHNPLSTFLTPQVFITNYKSVSSLDDQDGVGYLMGDRRRMSSTDVFREIVKEKIAGFPHIHVDESFIGQKDGKIFEGTDTHRVLKEGDIVSPIKLESPTTSRGTTVFVSIKNIAEAIQYGLIDDSTYFEEELQGSIQALAVNVVNGTISEPMEEAEATFSNLIVSTSSDLIQWTEASQNVPIAEFNDVEIFPRSQLKSYKESHFARRSLSVLEAEKRFQTHMSEFREAINAFVSHRDRVISMIEDTNSTSRHLASSLSWSERIAKFSYDTAQGELEEFTRSEITPSLAASLGVSSTAPGLTTYTRNGKSYVSFASFKTSISTECSQFLTEIEDMYSNIDFFILNQVGVLYDLSVRLLEIITSLEQLEADLSNAINVEKKMGNVIPIIKRIPYAGPLANVFYRGFRSAILSATPVYNALKRLNNKIESIQLYSKIESIKNVSETVADNVNSARRMLTVGGRALVFVDAVCPSTRSKTSVVCQSMNDVMGPANNEMNELKAKIQTFVRDVSNGLRTVASTAEDVLTNTVFQTAKNVLASAGRMFDSLDDLLDQRIRACAWNPVCGWREKEVCETIKIRIPEVEWCSKWGVDYPCGTSYTTKSKRVCVDVSVPYGCDACLRFTIRDIVNGAAQIASFIADALESALDKAIQALGIKFDIFTIPGLPNMEVIDRVSDGLESTFSSLGFDTKMSLVKTVNVQRDAMTQSLDLSKIPQCS